MTLVLLGRDNSSAFGWAAAVFAVAAISDFFDGYLARRWEQTTILGAYLDTLADKLLITGALFALVAVDRAWAWAAFVLVGREIAIMTLRGIVALDGSAVPPSYLGKAKATLQFLAIGLAMLRSGGELGPLYLDEWAMLAAVVVTVASGVDYLARFARVVKTVGS